MRILIITLFAEISSIVTSSFAIPNSVKKHLLIKDPINPDTIIEINIVIPILKEPRFVRKSINDTGIVITRVEIINFGNAFKFDDKINLNNTK